MVGGRRAGRSGRVGAMEATPALDSHAPAPPRRPSSRSSTPSRTSRPRSPRSRLASDCASRGRSSRSSSRWRSSRFFLYLNRERLAAVPELILQANPALVLLAFIVFYLGFPLARLSLEAAPARDRLRDQPAQLGRDPVHLVVRQLRRAGQARRRLPRLPAQDEQRGLAQPDVRDGLHRAHPRHLRDRDPRPRGRLLELPRRAAAGDPAGLHRRHRGRGHRRRRPVHDAQLRPADPRPAAAPADASSSSTSASRRASSGRSGCATCRSSRS